MSVPKGFIELNGPNGNELLQIAQIVRIVPSLKPEEGSRTFIWLSHGGHIEANEEYEDIAAWLTGAMNTPRRVKVDAARS